MQGLSLMEFLNVIPQHFDENHQRVKITNEVIIPTRVANSAYVCSPSTACLALNIPEVATLVTGENRPHIVRYFFNDITKDSPLSQPARRFLTNYCIASLCILILSRSQDEVRVLFDEVIPDEATLNRTLRCSEHVSRAKLLTSCADAVGDMKKTLDDCAEGVTDFGLVYVDILNFMGTLIDYVEKEHARRLNESFASVGHVPPIWSRVVRMRTILISYMSVGPDVFRALKELQRGGPKLYAVDFLRQDRSVTVYELVDLFMDLPRSFLHVDITFLRQFAELAYPDEVEIFNAYSGKTTTSFRVHRPSLSILLQQFVVLHLEDWETCWKRLGWPRNPPFLKHLATTVIRQIKVDIPAFIKLMYSSD